MPTGIVSRPWAGIDVGAWSVKVVGEHGTRHWAAEVRNTVPPEERDQAASAERIAKLIADCIERSKLGIRGLRGVTLSVAGADVILKQITLPYMDEDEVGSALRFEARKHLPFDPEGMILDFQIVGRSMTERRMDILLAAVSRDRMERRLAPLKLLGINPEIVDAAPLALTNALLHGSSNPANPTETRMFLDIGHLGSHLVLYHRAEPFFARRFDFGGRSMHQALARGMKMPIEDAERWIVSLGAAPLDWQQPELALILDALRFDLLEEIRRSVAFYRTIGKLHEPLSLRLSGGVARLPGIGERIGELLEMPVEVFDALRVFDGSESATDLRGPAPQFAQALGLAMRSA